MGRSKHPDAYAKQQIMKMEAVKGSQRQNKFTQKDIAQVLDVSQSAVSRVLRQNLKEEEWNRNCLSKASD